MREFILYSANDPNKEPIKKIKASSPTEAINIFCEIKQLPLSEFLKIFRVNEI
jgi:hypothetical protein